MCEDVNRIRHQLVNQLMKHRSIKITRRGVDRPLGGGAVAATSFAYPSPVSFDFHFLLFFVIVEYFSLLNDLSDGALSFIARGLHPPPATLHPHPRASSFV